MVKALTQFSFEQTTIRTFGTKFAPWFVAIDVLRALGIHTKNVSRAIETLDDDEKGVVKLTTPGGEQEAWIISEPGFYKIALRARTEKAKAFTRWVTHEVLPSIRRRGYYLDPRWGIAPTEDGMFVLATGERLTPIQVKQRAEKLGVSMEYEMKEVIREINQRESYLSMCEKYPYTEKDIESISKSNQEADYYECFIPENADWNEYYYWKAQETRYSEKFAELVRRIDKQYL